jgi:hypothetical protein
MARNASVPVLHFRMFVVVSFWHGATVVPRARRDKRARSFLRHLIAERTDTKHVEWSQSVPVSREMFAGDFAP